MEANGHGASTQKVDRLVMDLGLKSGASGATGATSGGNSMQSWVPCVASSRPHHVPCLFLDPASVTAHEGAKVMATVVVTAAGVTQDGEREGAQSGRGRQRGRSSLGASTLPAESWP